MVEIMMEKIASDLLDSQVQDDYSLGRISARVKTVDADELAAKAPQIEDFRVRLSRG